MPVADGEIVTEDVNQPVRITADYTSFDFKPNEVYDDDEDNISLVDMNEDLL